MKFTRYAAVFAFALALGACAGQEEATDEMTTEEMTTPAPAPAPITPDTTVLDSAAHDTMTATTTD